MSTSSVEPRLFVDWSACERVLSSCVTGGVRVCCLLSLDGSVLCVAGDLHAAKLLSALLSSVYASYSEAGSDEWQAHYQQQQREDEQQQEEAQAGEALRSLTVACDDGLVSVARVGRFLVAVQSDSSAAMGQVQHKVGAVVSALQPLVSVYE